MGSGDPGSSLVRERRVPQECRGPPLHKPAPRAVDSAMEVVVLEDLADSAEVPEALEQEAAVVDRERGEAGVRDKWPAPHSGIGAGEIRESMARLPLRLRIPLLTPSHSQSTVWMSRKPHTHKADSALSSVVRWLSLSSFTIRRRSSS